MSPCGSPAESREPGGPEPLSSEAAVVGTDILGERISGAPSGPFWALICEPRPGSRRWVSAAACATRLHSSSQAAMSKARVNRHEPLFVYNFFFLFSLLACVYSQTGSLRDVVILA